MSIRINKRIGYGTRTRLNGRGIEKADIKISDFIWYCHKNKEFIDKICVPDQSLYFLEKIDYAQYRSLKNEILRKYIVCNENLLDEDGEYGCESAHVYNNIIHFVVPGHDEWILYDNIIDHIEECNDYGIVNRFTIYEKRTIFPYLRPPWVVAAMCVLMGRPKLFKLLKTSVFAFWS